MENNNNRKFDLEKRMIDFAGMILKLVDKLPKGIGPRHLGGQIVRSGTSPALNYAEAISAESKNDFIHKMSIVAKELRETRVCLDIITGQNYVEPELVKLARAECNQLVLIVSKSIRTTRENIEKS